MSNGRASSTWRPPRPHRSDRFFGRSNLERTLFGPFDSSLENLLFGELKIVRRGTGDFTGMVMRGATVQEPPGSSTEVERGEIFVDGPP